ncbi:hypothetical protein TRIUR3_22700 [Triticum urartu]|uniref:DUF4220 domain-containing protein n=1 Tax=Triticum urartu TaxID=4572 RepID=M7ZAV6_TRIUA|nr:hypothetical protein TRIUR3_22700 [Triticum urartu]
MGVGYLTVQKCNSDESEIFAKHITGAMFRVNALLLVNAILMGVMVVIGAYGRYRSHPLTRYIFLGATALFIPIISYVLSDIGNQNGLILFADGEKIIGRLCNSSFHMNLVLIWTGLVQMVGISTTLVVVSDPREGRNIGPSGVLLVQAMWTSYLMFYNIGLKYHVPYEDLYIASDIININIEWSLVYVFSLASLVIIPPFALTFAKLFFKCFAWYKARKSLAIGCNPRLIVGYMEQLQHDPDIMTNDYRDIPPPLIVMGEDTISVDKQPHGYSFSLMPNRGGLVTLDKVWQLDDMHDLKLTSHLKDVCLSFALSKLLRCRFARYTNDEIGFTKASSFLQHLLLDDTDDGRVLRVTEYELSFLHDFYYSSLAISYSKSWMPILSMLISLSAIGYCLVVIVYVQNNSLIYMEGRKLPLISCFYQCKGEKKGNMIEINHGRFGNAIFDIVPVVVLMALVVLAETREIASYICSNLTKVVLVCRYINHASWQQSPIFYIMKKCIRHVLQCRCKMLNHLEDKMNQCSILVLHPRKNPMGLLRRLKPGQKVKVPRAVKAAILTALRSYERSRHNNRMPSLCTRPQLKTGDNLLWMVDGTKGIANTILVCHIATSILELRSAGSCQTLSDHKIAAIHLSRYCAYLVAHSPELLPDDDEWCKSLYKTVKKKAEHILARVSTTEVEYQQLVELVSASQNHEVLKDGAKLGQQLAELNQGEANTAWELLAGFWSEMMLYIAPSDNIDGHSEAIARGGELITLLWALLAHLGIFSRAGDPASIAVEVV